MATRMGRIVVRVGNRKVIGKPYGLYFVMEFELYLQGVPGLMCAINGQGGSGEGGKKDWDWHLEVIPSLCREPDGEQRVGWLASLLGEG